jgi:tripartite-type tricarboxylate transporter receptor subunit TctC
VIDRRQMMAMTAASALAPTALAGPARGQSSAGWPARPVRLIVPYAPGGPTDAVARLVADSLSRTWGQQVVIENKGGAGTNIGADLVAHADPDGYTMLIGSGALAINRNLYRTLTYDAISDFAPVVHICGFSFFMLVPVSSPARSVKDFVALANERKGKMTFASPGTGSPPHLAGELLKHLTKIEMTHVPYRGAGPAFTDLIAGRVELFFGSGISVEQVKAGKLRALAFSGATRSTALPGVPTVAESGVPGYEVSSWYGLFVPAKTPAPIVANINAATLKALAEPNIRTRLDELGYAIGGSTPGELAALLNSEINKWAPIIKSALEPQ